MGHKIFVSYKYADKNVKNISGSYYPGDTARTYVDYLADYLSNSSAHIYKGEDDGEDLSKLDDKTIWDKLRDRIYDSTLTIILISPGMRDTTPDRDQWIPWEISYSLKETARKNIKGEAIYSKSNALLAIVLPDKNGGYNYYTEHKKCCSSGCRYLNTGFLFTIMKKNMFNIKVPDKYTCDLSSTVYRGNSSYILSVTWEDFVSTPEEYINTAYEIKDNIDLYNIVKEV